MLFLICGFISRGFSQTSLPNEILDQNKVQQYGFIENKGQVHDQFYRQNNSVKFLLPAKGMNVLLKTNSFSYDTYVTETASSRSETPGKQTSGSLELPDSGICKSHRVDISLLDANSFPEIISEERSSDYLIYYAEKNSAPLVVYHYRKVLYKDIYPGIDLVFDTRDIKGQSQFEYYFVVRPGGDVRKIRLKYAGAQTELNKGALTIKLRQGNIIERTPFSFLVPGAVNINFQNIFHNEKIKVAFKAVGQNVYGFQIPQYDNSKNLVIDPVPDLVWGTYYGEGDNDWGYGVVRDNNGNIIMAGGSIRSNALATAGAYQAVFAGETDGLVAMFQPNGVRLWATYYGGESLETFLAVNIDINNNIIVGGHTLSNSGISSAGCHQPVKGVGFDALVVKFNNAGFRIWGTYYGGESAEIIYGIKSDGNGNIFVVGYTVSTTGIATVGSHQPNYAGGTLGDSGDGFLVKFNANGVRQWASYYGGTSHDNLSDIVLDKSGNIYTTGATYSATGISTTGAFQSTHGGGTIDAMLVKFDNNGNRIWGTYFGSSAEDFAMAIAIDGQSNIVIGGRTMSQTGIATAGAHQTVFGGDQMDAFLAKFNSQGSRLWATYYGGNGIEEVSGLTTDLNDNIYVSAWTNSTNNISTPNVYQTTLGTINGYWGTFVGKLNSNGVRQWATYYGSNGPFGQGVIEDLVTDSDENVFVTGWTSFTNGIATCGAVQPNWGGNFDAFLAMFGEKLTSTPSVSIKADPVGTFCLGTPTTFTATAINGGTNPVYQWKLNGQNIGANNPVYVSNSLVNGDIVECVVTVVTSVCTAGVIINSNKIVATISTPVTPAITISASAISICTGNTVNFTAIAQNGGNTPVYQWKINGTNVGNNAAAFLSSTLQQGDIVSCELTSSNTCIISPVVVSNGIQMNVTPIPSPIITLSVSPNPICPGETATLNCATLNLPASFSYQWKVNGINVGTNSAEYSDNKFKNGDIVNCMLLGSIAGCSDPFSFVSGNNIVITVKTVPIVDLSASDTVIFAGDSVLLTPTVTGAISGFVWSPSASLDDPGILNPVATPLMPTRYNFLATGTNGCITEKSIFINVLQELFIPNAFTPNKDGKNELFKVPDGISSLNSFSIYNRWGNEIFRTKDIHKGWDGTYKGKDCPIGVYIYILKGRSSKGPVFLKGILTLIR
jgi:gliding motility-associated-like protein